MNRRGRAIVSRQIMSRSLNSGFISVGKRRDTTNSF
ncbi:hypothetical protein SLEP1_g49400 [Rubroshorea leprosula]|uniref:Uncharacterized protein n=1 Tax=Rubroshorea leprosula TaxID=152421 RepID=A0AAV5LWR4_9ROSI|nr:hypothetical protein SLEP1_g49400 [Rubroshorea leprosula]